MRLQLLSILVVLASSPALSQTCDVMRPCAPASAARHGPRVAARPVTPPARPAAATAGVGSVTASSGASARVSLSAAGAFRCLIARLEGVGYPVRFMGGWRARGSVRGSLHPAGLALDVNQTSRNVTRPRMPANEIALANSCGLISGAQWAHADSGHFQLGGWDGAGRGGRAHPVHRHHRRR